MRPFLLGLVLIAAFIVTGLPVPGPSIPPGTGDARADTSAVKPEKAEAAAPDKQSKELGGWRAPEEARAVPNPVKSTPESVARGQTLYEKSCTKCHGPQGRGDGKMAKALARKPADLTLRLPLQSDGEIFWKVTQGKSPMPSFKKDLTANQRWDVVNYLRQMIIACAKAATGDSARAKGSSAPAGTAPGDTTSGS